MTNPVSAYFAAVNAEDWPALAGLWEPDAELVATGRRRRSAGHDHRPGRGAGPARASPGSRALATMIAPAQAGKRVLVEMDDVARLADALAGVRRTAPQGLAEWRYHGRLVARQLDDAHLVVRADFDYRDSLLRQFPGTFSVPARFTRHMMIVADIARGEAGAIEDALEAAWQLQRSAD